MRLPLLSLALLSTMAFASPADRPHHILDRYPGPDGGSDYISADGAAGRLYVGREFGVMVVDLATRQVSTLIDSGETAAVLIIPGTSLMLATAPEDDRAVLFDRLTGKRIADIPTGDGPDAAAFDPATNLALVMNGEDKTIALIDLAKRAVVGRIALPGVPEAAVSDGKGRVYVNLEDTAEVAVIDMKKRAVIARHPLAECEEPTGIALDAKTGTLISACHNGVSKLTGIGGEDRGTIRSGAEADGAVFDARRRTAYVSGNDGTLTIFTLDDQGKSGKVSTMPTPPRARTIALDPETGRVYLPNRRKEADASGKLVSVPGSFNIVVVGQE